MNKVSRHSTGSTKLSNKFKNKVKKELGENVPVSENEDKNVCDTSACGEQSHNKSHICNKGSTCGSASQEQCDIECTLEDFTANSAVVLENQYCSIDSIVNDNENTSEKKIKAINPKRRLGKRRKVTRILRRANFRATLLAEKYKRLNAQLKTKSLTNSRKQPYRGVKNLLKKRCGSSAEKQDMGFESKNLGDSFRSGTQKCLKTLFPKIRVQKREERARNRTAVKPNHMTKENKGIKGNLQARSADQNSITVTNCDDSLSIFNNSQDMQKWTPTLKHFGDQSKNDSYDQKGPLELFQSTMETMQYVSETKFSKCAEEESDIMKLLQECTDMKMEDSHTEETCGKEQIKCICGVKVEEGLMIQCDSCHSWQHALCNDIEHEDDVPRQFCCYFCQTTEHRQKNEIDDQSWFYTGHLPRFSFSNEDEEDIAKKEAAIAASHKLLAQIEHLKNILYSLQVKTVVAQTPNHPKLILWNNQQMEKERQNISMDPGASDVKTVNSDYPQPEAAIDFNQCQKNLEKYLQECHLAVKMKLRDIEKEFEDLEKEFLSSDCKVTDTEVKEAMKVVMSDLRKIMSISK